MCLSNLILLSPTEFFAIAPQSLNSNKSPTENKMRLSAQHSYTRKQLMEISSHIKPTNLTSLSFGTIRTIHKLRLNNRASQNRNRKRRKTTWDRINTWNLIQIATTDENCDKIVKSIRLSTVPAKLIKRQIKPNQQWTYKQKNRYTNCNWNLATRQWAGWNMGLHVQTRTIIISDIYKKQKQPKRRGHCPHYKQKLQQKDVHAYSSFEHNILNTQLGSWVYNIIGIYHPPQGTGQQCNNSYFMAQYTDLLRHVLLVS